MKQIHLLTIISALTCISLSPLQAAENIATKDTQKVVANDQATQKHIGAKADHLLAAIKLDDSAKATRVKAIISEWLVTMWNWHQQNDTQLDQLWSDWGKARSASPNDEFPGEIVEHKIMDVYASLKPAYDSFTNKLATELTPEQIDNIKDTWSRKPGMTRTYKAYLQIIPDLTEAQKQVVHDQLLGAREDAMLTDSDREIVNIYKCHKLKVQAYIGKLEWDKLYSDFVHRAKTH